MDLSIGIGNDCYDDSIIPKKLLLENPDIEQNLEQLLHQFAASNSKKSFEVNVDNSNSSISNSSISNCSSNNSNDNNNSNELKLKKRSTGPKGIKKKPWSIEETKTLEFFLECYHPILNGNPPWAFIRDRHGKNGSIDNSLSQRSHVDLQDKARIITGQLWRDGKEIPPWLQCAKPPKRIIDKMRPIRGEWPSTKVYKSHTKHTEINKQFQK